MTYLNLLADSTQPNYMSWIIFAVALGLLFAMMFANKNKWDKDRLASLDVKEFIETMRKGSLIDIRKPKEIEESGKIVGSRNFPGKSGAGDARVRKDLPVFIYDQKGNSNLKGIAAKYIKNGAVMVYVLRGGYDAYKSYKEKNN